MRRLSWWRVSSLRELRNRTTKSEGRPSAICSCRAWVRHCKTYCWRPRLRSPLTGRASLAPAVREALELPDGWEPTFLVLLGHPEEGFEAAPRADVEVGDVMVER